MHAMASRISTPSPAALLVAALLLAGLALWALAGQGGASDVGPIGSADPVILDGVRADLAAPEAARQPGVRVRAQPVPGDGAGEPEQGLELRGWLREQDGRPCAGVPMVQLGGDDVRQLGETQADGSFAVTVTAPLLGPVEFGLAAGVVAQFRPERLPCRAALFVPRLLPTSIGARGLDSDETWVLDTFPIERRQDGTTNLRDGLTLELACAEGSLQLVMHHVFRGELGGQARVELQLPEASEWTHTVRAQRHTFRDPVRRVLSGAATVFSASGLEQRLAIEIVDGSGLPVPVAGLVHVQGEKGWSHGNVVGGRAELRSPSGSRIEGDLDVLCVLKDGETIARAVAEASWSAASRVELRRGTGRMSIEVAMSGSIRVLHGQRGGGSPFWLDALSSPGSLQHYWWRSVAGGVEVNVPDEVLRLWAVDDAGRIGVADRLAPRQFDFQWLSGRTERVANPIEPEGLGLVFVEWRVPGAGDGAWLEMLRVTSVAELTSREVFHTDGVDYRLVVLRILGGKKVREREQVVWR